MTRRARAQRATTNVHRKRVRNWREGTIARLLEVGRRNRGRDPEETDNDDMMEKE